MNRRTYLQGICGGLVSVSGCLGSDIDTPFVTNRSIEVTDRGCGTQQNRASLDYDETTDQLHVEGVLSGTSKCGELNLSYAYNETSDRVIVEVLLTDNAQCASCTRFYEYEGTVSFRETPSVAVVFHSDPEILKGVGTVTLKANGSATSTT